MRAYYRAYNSEDEAALAGYYHEDVELVSGEGTLRGRDAILETYRHLTGLFHDKMTPLFISIDGDTAVVDILDRFTAKRDVGEFMGSTLREGESLVLRLRGTYQAIDGRFRRIAIEQTARPEAVSNGTNGGN